MAHSWTHITEEATSDKGFSLKDRTAFQYFNPNGSYAAFQKTYEILLAEVEKGAIKSGALLAYDGAYYINMLMRQVQRKQPSKWKAEYAAKCLVEEAEKIVSFIKEDHTRKGVA